MPRRDRYQSAAVPGPRGTRYLTIITLIFYRFMFVALTVDQVTPPYWINMGAVAITALAGSSLLEFLSVIPQVTVYLALAAWAVTFVAMMRHLWRGLPRSL